MYHCTTTVPLYYCTIPAGGCRASEAQWARTAPGRRTTVPLYYCTTVLYLRADVAHQRHGELEVLRVDGGPHVQRVHARLPEASRSARHERGAV
eukprot:9169876-Pyramimonas_sp.AAC.1